MTEDEQEKEKPRYKFILFLAGDQPNSILARKNFKEVCAELEGEYELEIVDVLKDAKPALQHGIVVTPALLVLEPKPKVVIAGSLNDRARVLVALRQDAPV